MQYMDPLHRKIPGVLETNSWSEGGSKTLLQIAVSAVGLSLKHLAHKSLVTTPSLQVHSITLPLLYISIQLNINGFVKFVLLTQC